MREYVALLDRHIEIERSRLLGSAMVCSMLANVNRDSEARPEPFTPADFMPWIKQEEPEVEEDPLEVVKRLNAALGGKMAIVKGG